MSNKDPDDIGGRMAANFRRANIAEGLAILLFRPFAAIANVAREEDYGIDFIATLTSKKDKVLIAEDSFVVQVKIHTSPIFKFAGDGVEWLTSLKLPYFPVVVDLDTLTASLYTLNEWHMPLFCSRVNKYNFVVQNDHFEGDGLDDFPLGEALMQWSIQDCFHSDFPRWAYDILKQVIRIESANFNFGRMWRFERLECPTYKFDPNNPVPPKLPKTEINIVPPGDEEAIKSIFGYVIGPFANLLANQKYDVDKSGDLLRIRDLIRSFEFDPDPNNKWDEIANDMSELFAGRS